ncbi:pilus assembly protein [Vibrio metschnikovii]|uniref:pilus assembly protein n=1 Tax=Vibrio metschnikovii TaxID=28172 RepID=UPI002FC7DE85
MGPKSIQRQSGHAAILFALCIPILFGVFALGTDGARAVQDKARLLEAIEVASLAVAGQGSDNKVLAKSYLQYYFPLAKINDADITINKINCEDNAACKGQERRFFEYQVSAHITQPTWFPGNDAIIGFGKNYQVFDRSVTRKYHAKTVDVIFVADFSGSMSNAWEFDAEDIPEDQRLPKVKYKAVQKIIENATNELNKFNKYYADDERFNRAAFTAFGSHVFPHRSCQLDHREYDCTRVCNWWGLQCRDECVVNYSRTLDNIFVDKKTRCAATTARYHSLYLVPKDKDSDFSAFVNKVDSFSPHGWTASFQGLIEGAYIANSIPDPNPRQLIILLSDGEDLPWETNAKDMEELTKLGLCKRILSQLESKQSTTLAGESEPVQARLAMIGFDYDIKNNPALTKCIGQDNVFQASTPNAIQNKILELITEEIGHLAPQR